MQASSTNSICPIKACAGLDCSNMALNHTARVESLSLYIHQARRVVGFNDLSPDSSFLEYMSTQGLFGTDKNNIHCALCHRTAKIVEISHRKITYIRNVFHNPCCNYFKDPADWMLMDPQYIKFEDRIETFNNWPREKKQTPCELSIVGFSFLKLPDTVRCFCCGGIVCNWAQNHKPDEIHAALFPECAFINNIKGSVYVREMLQKQEHIRELRHSLNPEYDRRFAIEFPSISINYKTSTLDRIIDHRYHCENNNRRQPIYPYYKTEIARQASFSNVCSEDFQNIWLSSIVTAGMFLLDEQYARCYSCGFGVTKWDDPSISPMLLHHHFRPRCDYINSKNAKDIIKTLQSTHNLFIPEASQPPIGRAASLPDQNYLDRMNISANYLYSSFNKRRNTFTCWNHMLWQLTEKTLDEMARAGFYYSINKKKYGVYCFHCNNRVDGHKYISDIVKEHNYLYPECGWTEYRNSNEYILSEKDVETPAKLHPMNINYSFSNLNDRIETFLHQWPNASLAPDLIDMAESGLFFLSQPDTVCCFVCRIKISGWVSGDIPIFRHLIERNYCGFIKSAEGQRLIEKANSAPEDRRIAEQEDQSAP